jgi:hypothetical protein
MISCKVNQRPIDIQNLSKEYDISNYNPFQIAGNNRNLLSGKFIVDSTQLKIKEDWKYLEESEPGLIGRILQRQFPNKLEVGYQVNFVNDSTLVHNKIDTFSCYKTERQTLNIRQSDVVRELNYYEWYNAGIVLENQGKQGDFVYYLKRKTRDNK